MSYYVKKQAEHGSITFPIPVNGSKMGIFALVYGRWDKNTPTIICDYEFESRFQYYAAGLPPMPSAAECYGAQCRCVIFDDSFADE